MAMSWADRLARVPMPDEQLIEGMAEAIYQTHWRAREGSNTPTPTWAAASEEVREWVRKQARSALGYLRSLTRPAR